MTPRRLIDLALQSDSFERASRAAYPITFKETPMTEIPQHSRHTPDGPAVCEGSGTTHRRHMDVEPRCVVCNKRLASMAAK